MKKLNQEELLAELEVPIPVGQVLTGYRLEEQSDSYFSCLVEGKRDTGKEQGQHDASSHAPCSGHSPQLLAS